MALSMIDEGVLSGYDITTGFCGGGIARMQATKMKSRETERRILIVVAAAALGTGYVWLMAIISGLLKSLGMGLWKRRGEEWEVWVTDISTE